MGVWEWFPVTSDLVHRVCDEISSLSPASFLRALDAIHLTCAKEIRFGEIYTNDRHMLDCAQRFGLTGINLIP